MLYIELQPRDLRQFELNEQASRDLLSVSSLLLLRWKELSFVFCRGAVEPPASRPNVMSGYRRRPYFQRRPNRFIYRNEKKIACLAVTSRGYTITNGVITASRDGCFPESDLIAEIFEFKARLLVVVDENTSNLVKRLKRQHLNPELIRVQTFIPDKDDPRPVCGMCRQRNCHRWKAASALTLVYRFPLDCAPHYPPADPSRYPSTSSSTKINAPGAGSSRSIGRGTTPKGNVSVPGAKVPPAAAAASASSQKKVAAATSSRKIPPAASASASAASVPKRIGSTVVDLRATASTKVPPAVRVVPEAEAEAAAADVEPKRSGATSPRKFGRSSPSSSSFSSPSPPTPPCLEDSPASSGPDVPESASSPEVPEKPAASSTPTPSPVGRSPVKVIGEKQGVGLSVHSPLDFSVFDDIDDMDSENYNENYNELFNDLV